MGFVKYLSLLIFVWGASPVLAHGDHSHGGRRCSDALGKVTLPQIRMSNSGRDMDLQAELEEAARIIYQDIAPKLGLKIPDMVIKSLSANDMAALTANSGHPAPHWHDGMAVMQSARRAGNILEFVETGRESHVQYVRDVNTFLETLIVYAHVVGHYDFAETSYVFGVRDGDRIRDSYELSQYMSKLYRDHDGEEVDQFYQWLLSTKMLQDTARGSFQSPNEFIAERASRRRRVEAATDPLSISKTEVVVDENRHPRAPSQSVMQSMVENLPTTSSEFKTEMFRRFERLHRVFPAIMLTKIMNEGWATLMEYIILAHSPWNNGNNVLDFAAINAQVNVPGLSNPYWLGLNAWLRLRERFLKARGLEEADALTQDKAFIAYARDIIARYTDYDFLMLAFDDKWIEKHDLFLYRKATPEEKGGMWGPDKNVAITRDARRVVKHIADKVANFEKHFPQFEIIDFNDNDSGSVRIRHKVINGVPLDRSTIAKATYVLTQIFERPVVLETVGTNLWVKPKRPPHWNPWIPRPMPELDDAEDLSYSYGYSIRVTPQGEVEVEYDESDERIRMPEGFKERFEAQIEGYQRDMGSNYPSQIRSDRMEDLITQTLNLQELPVKEAANIMGHAPTASEAVFKYQQLMRRRSRDILYLAAQGKWPIKYSNGGRSVRIRLLPEIPEFQLDRNVAKKLTDLLDPTPVSVHRTDMHMPTSLDLTDAMNQQQDQLNRTGHYDRDLDIGQGPYQPGDKWDRPPEEDGQGEGDPDDGDPSDDPSDQAGDGVGDPQYDESTVDVPIELFAEMIADQFELRNLRKLQNGKNRLMKTKRGASIQNPEGILNEERTAENDLANGMAIIESWGKNPQDYSIDEIFEIGIKHRTPADHVVASRIPIFKPDFDAVILYVADTSGSMGPEHRKIERKMVAYISAVLKSAYPHLEERFVIYDTEALEVEREEFFSRHQGGGTATVSGLKVAAELLEDFPSDRYNRYVHLFSDGGDSQTADAVSFVRDLIKEIEYFGYAHIEPGSSWYGRGELSDAFEELAQELRDEVGFAELDESHESLMKGLEEYYGKQSK